MPAIFIIVIVSLFISHRPSHGAFAGPSPITSSLLHSRARRCLNLASPHRSVVVFFATSSNTQHSTFNSCVIFVNLIFPLLLHFYYYFRLLWLSSPHPAWTLIYNSCITTTEKKQLGRARTQQQWELELIFFLCLHWALTQAHTAQRMFTGRGENIGQAKKSSSIIAGEGRQHGNTKKKIESSFGYTGRSLIIIVAVRSSLRKPKREKIAMESFTGWDGKSSLFFVFLHHKSHTQNSIRFLSYSEIVHNTKQL